MVGLLHARTGSVAVSLLREHSAEFAPSVSVGIIVPVAFSGGPSSLRPNHQGLAELVLPAFGWVYLILIPDPVTLPSTPTWISAASGGTSTMKVLPPGQRSHNCAGGSALPITCTGLSSDQ